MSRCFSCRQQPANVGEQKMADLLHDQVNPSTPRFSCVGVDYFEPFMVCERRCIVKQYGVIFICLAIRAIHLEIAVTLNTNSFIMALRRFIFHRGQAKEFRSDNRFTIIYSSKRPNGPLTHPWLPVIRSMGKVK